jgi:membrane fusion protein (multidrug efflux system)
MKSNRILTTLAGAAIACGIGYWWYSSHAAGQQDAPASAENASALVVTQPARQQRLPLTMDTFGEIATGKPDSLSFPQAGQVTALPVVLGQHVRRGELLASLASDPTAVSAYAQAANAVGFARRELTRQQELLGLQLATQTQVDSARKQLEDAQAALAAQARLGGARAGAELRAPYDGIVSALAVGQGDRIAAGAAVVQLGRADRLRALLALEPAQSALVRAGMPVTISPILDGAKPFEASIASTGELVDPKTQMVSAIVELPAGQRGRLVAGTRVQALIRIGQRDAWAVPRQAVLSDDQGAYLFQVRASKAHRVAVTRIAELGQTYGVAGQVDGSLPVVVLGNYELSEGMAVREDKQ